MRWRRESLGEIKATRRARAALPIVASEERPRTRADCADVPRPCPFVGCRYNLFLEVTLRGDIRYNHPEKDPTDIHEACSCALDVVDALNTRQESKVRQIRETSAPIVDGKIADGADLNTVAALFGLTHQRLKQVEQDALFTLARALKKRGGKRDRRANVRLSVKDLAPSLDIWGAVGIGWEK